MKVGIIDYGMGNLTSVSNALNFIGKEADLVSHSTEIASYDTLILPGVGAFGKAMDRIHSAGLGKPIIEAANQGKKVIGICLGMQLLFSKSYEFGEHEGLNLIEGEVLPFEAKDDLRIPHMGWNSIHSRNENFEDFNSDYYFVHSFYCKPKNDNNILFTANYGIEFCAGATSGDNVFGLQFHPEKSQKKGIELLSNILG